MVFITSVLPLFLASLVTVSRATPIDGIGEIKQFTIGGTYCSNNNGAGSVVATSTDPTTGAPSCICTATTGPAAGETVCGGSTPACTETTNFVAATGASTSTAVCGSCATGNCGLYTSSDTQYINNCASGQSLYIILGVNNCICSDAAEIAASGINPSLAVQCTSYPNAYARCRSNEYESVAGTAASTQNANCGYGCNAGYTITRNDLNYPTGCQANASPVPKRKRAVEYTY